MAKKQNTDLQSAPPETIIPRHLYPEYDDLGLICSSHCDIFSNCSHCLDSVTVGMITHKRNQRLLNKLNSEVQVGERLKAEVKLLKRELEDILSSNKTGKIDNKSDIHQVLLDKKLPKNFLDIFESAERSLSYMIKLDTIQKHMDCKRCGEKMFLQGRGGFGFNYYCERCRVKVDYKVGTFWEKCILEPNQILWLMLLWVVKARDIEISHLMEISVGYVNSITSRIRKIVARDYLNTLPVFNGVVEINIRNFVKRKIEIGKSKAKERWVIIIVERDRTLVYMEALVEKTHASVLKIIQKRCDVGTVILTEKHAVYGNLENYGYPHYSIEKNRGFTYLQGTKLNISKAYGQWAWIKHAIKRYNRTSSYLNDYLLEFMWRNTMKHKLQQGEIIRGLFNTSFVLVSKCKSEEIVIPRTGDEDPDEIYLSD